MNADLERERSNATFVMERLINLMDGGSQERTHRHRQLEAIVAADPVFSNQDNIYSSIQERHVRAIAKSVRLVQVCRQLRIGLRQPGLAGSAQCYCGCLTIGHSLDHVHSQYCQFV